MFAYCYNNPIIYADDGGTLPHIPMEKIYNDGQKKITQDNPGEYYDPETDRYYLGVSGDVYYVSNHNNNGGTIHFSATVEDNSEIYRICRHLVLDSMFSSDFSGSVEAVYYEWILHNIVAELAFTTGYEEENINMYRRAVSVDVGSTLYDDEHGKASVIMWAGFDILFPESAASDRLIFDSRGE